MPKIILTSAERFRQKPITSQYRKLFAQMSKKAETGNTYQTCLILTNYTLDRLKNEGFNIGKEEKNGFVWFTISW